MKDSLLAILGISGKLFQAEQALEKQRSQVETHQQDRLMFLPAFVKATAYSEELFFAPVPPPPLSKPESEAPSPMKVVKAANPIPASSKRIDSKTTKVALQEAPKKTKLPKATETAKKKSKSKTSAEKPAKEKKQSSTNTKRKREANSKTSKTSKKQKK